MEFRTKREAEEAAALADFAGRDESRLEQTYRGLPGDRNARMAQVYSTRAEMSFAEAARIRALLPALPD